MNSLKQILMNMGLSWTTLIESVIFLLFFILFKFWFVFLLFLAFCGFIAFKIWILLNQMKRRNRDDIFSQNIPKTMKGAYYSTSWSRIIDFSDYLVPVITKGDELLIKVHSASLNPVDYKMNFNRIPFYRWHVFPNFGIGKDFSGEVVQVGNMISKYRIGDNVYGFSKYGSFQEYTIAKESWVNPIPDRVKFEQAASVPLVGCTTYQALTYFYQNNNNIDNVYDQYGYEPDLDGKNVLVIGASGGCGHVGVQIAKFLNANEVYGVCSHDNVEIIKNLGVCEDVFAYDSEEFQNTLETVLCTGDGHPKIDLILDTVSSRGDGDVGKMYMRFLREDGKYVGLNSSSIIQFCTGLTRFVIPKLNCEKKGIHVHFLNRDDSKGLEVLSRMMSQGKITFLTNSVSFEPQAIEQAIKMLKSRRTRGKLVCNIIEDNSLI
jgi:alcohol dehydrogenase